MKPYFVYSTLFLLSIFLWIATIFFLNGEAAGCVGFVATLLSGFTAYYGITETQD